MSKYNKKKEYYIFLASDEWSLIKSQLFAERGAQCSKCYATKNLQVHHKNYDKPWGKELPEDLTILCNKHHMMEHGLLKKKKRRKKKRGKRNTHTSIKPTIILRTKAEKLAIKNRVFNVAIKNIGKPRKVIIRKIKKVTAGISTSRIIKIINELADDELSNDYNK